MRIVLGDITKMDTDAIVNAAVSDLLPSSRNMQRNSCRSGYGGVEKGLPEDWAMPNRHAVVTPSCGLPSKIIFHVAGAGWYGGVQRERMLLEECYRRALQKALLYNCRTVAVH